MSLGLVGSTPFARNENKSFAAGAFSSILFIFNQTKTTHINNISFFKHNKFPKEKHRMEDTCLERKLTKCRTQRCIEECLPWMLRMSYSPKHLASQWKQPYFFFNFLLFLLIVRCKLCNNFTPIFVYIEGLESEKTKAYVFLLACGGCQSAWWRRNNDLLKNLIK